VDSGGRETASAWLCVFGFFLGCIKKGYRRTFFDVNTGVTTTTDLFLSEDDSIKKRVLECQKLQWWHLREDVEAWLRKS